MSRVSSIQYVPTFSPLTFPLDDKGIECFTLAALPRRRRMVNSLFDSTQQQAVFAEFIGKEVLGEALVRLPVCITEMDGQPTPEDVRSARAMDWHNRIIRGWMTWVDTRIEQSFKVGVVVAFCLPYRSSKMGMITLTMEGGLYTQYKREIATILAEVTGEKK